MKVNCAFDKLVPVPEVKANPRNPYRHPDEQLKLLAKIIEYQGWRHPIVVSNQSGFIVHGHARLDAAKLNGYTEVPVDYQDYVDEAQEYADLIADNQIQELAETDEPTLKDIIGELDTGAIDLELTGFTTTMIEDMMTNVPARPVLIDGFTPGQHGKSKKDECWLYVEFYGKPERFAEIKEKLGSALKGEHEMDAAWFTEKVAGIESSVEI